MGWSDLSTSGKGLRVGLWLVTVVETLMMAGAGVSKFLPGGRATWTEMFLAWGYPNGVSLVVGGVELVCALLLLAPRVAAWAALALLVVMLGALGTVVLHQSDLGVGGPLIHGLLLTLILWGRWRDRLGRPASSR